MFQKLDIHYFRGIRNASVEHLGQVNLFWGKNNCGKSSLLDAIFLVTGQSNPLLPVNINRMRDYRGVSEKDFGLNFYNFDTQNAINIVAYNQEPRSLSITELKSSTSEVNILSDSGDLSTTAQNRRYGYNLTFSSHGEEMHSRLVLQPADGTSIKQKIEIDSRYNETIQCRYISPKYDFQLSIDGLAEVIKNKAEGYILDALRVVEPKIRDIQVSQMDILVDIGLSQRIPINLLGDGTRKMLAIASIIFECRNGVVLIDEVSNGFHYSVMTNLWKVIIKAAHDNNVQVFATTHDLDSIKGLSRAIAETEGLDEGFVSSFKLQKNGEDLAAYRYSPKQLGFAIEQEIEMR